MPRTCCSTTRKFVSPIHGRVRQLVIAVNQPSITRFKTDCGRTKYRPILSRTITFPRIRNSLLVTTSLDNFTGPVILFFFFLSRFRPTLYLGTIHFIRLTTGIHRFDSRLQLPATHRSHLPPWVRACYWATHTSSSASIDTWAAPTFPAHASHRLHHLDAIGRRNTLQRSSTKVTGASVLLRHSPGSFQQKLVTD